MFEAMSKVDRQALGFTQVGREASIRLEEGPRRGYDAMLHIEGKTSRTVAFKSIGSGYESIGEQESFRGPRKYKTVDGEFQESITLTYDTGQSRAFRSTSFQSSTLEKTLLLCGRVSCRSKQFAQRSLDGGTDIAQRGLLRAEISKHYVHAADGLLVLMGFVRRAGSQEWSKPLVVAAIMLLERYLTTW